MKWIISQIQKLLKTLLDAAYKPDLFQLGGKYFSLISFTKFLFFILVAFVIARLLSEGIKRWFLVRFGFDRGTREAIASVIGYVLAVFGFFLVIQSFGLNLSSLTVIAGALGIGFGFGFQTLASNFLSGITLLLEQPVKVGDFIEVNNLLGTVEKISIRSTVIRTLDGVFVIVPNNKFVENNIINWSYQDLRCRLHIPVGVAYESDPVLVTEALLSAARKEPRVLSYPSPKVFFTGFGDSALDFELLVWIDDPPQTEPIKSSLHFRLESELRYRGIHIPFPQRDLHIQNMDVLSPILPKNSSLSSPQNGKKSVVQDTPPKQVKAMPKSPSNWTLRDLLRRISYFEKCSQLEIKELIEYGYRQLVPKDQLVCQEGDLGESFYLILSGEVEVFSQQKGQYIATLHEGEFFGEISLLMGTARTASVRTLEDTILFVVDRNDLQVLLVNHQNLADQIAEQLAERQRSLQNMGLIAEDLQMDDLPFIWIRKRIKTIFGI